MRITQAQTARYSLRPQTKANVLLSLLLDVTKSLNFAALLFNISQFRGKQTISPHNFTDFEIFHYDSPEKHHDDDVSYCLRPLCK